MVRVVVGFVRSELRVGQGLGVVMYISGITIKNYGPIEDLDIEMPFDDGRPKPLVLVGQNGAGKSLLLANIVNALVAGRQTVFDDSDVESGKVYKYRMASYVLSGKSFSYGAVRFQSGAKVEELQLVNEKSALEELDDSCTGLEIFNVMQPDQTSVFASTFAQYPTTAPALFQKQCCLYFPVHRNEEPAWLNVENATKRAGFLKLKNILRFSNRDFIVSSPLGTNRDWLLDLLLDKYLYEPVVRSVPIGNPLGAGVVNIFEGYRGESTNVYEAILKLVQIILRQGDNVRLGVGRRKNRQISIMKDEVTWVPNLFQLSTGEMQLFNLFLTIVRDFDLSEGAMTGMADIAGVVIIDEIDTHLHTSHQINVLPELIASFPKVQFIITTHSPLFLIGLQRQLGVDGFSALQMPTGMPVSMEGFSEFGEAYEAFLQTERHKAEIKKSIDEFHGPVLYVEGDYDIRYLTKAADLLGWNYLLERLSIRDGGGSGNLDKIWRTYDNPTSAALPQKLILLYDCDTRKPDGERGQIYKRTMPVQADNPIAIGIENLFPEETILSLEQSNPQFIDLQAATTKRIRSDTVEVPCVRSVNKDEKGNMCNWLCENGSAQDFVCFNRVFEAIAGVIDMEG